MKKRTRKILSLVSIAVGGLVTGFVIFVYITLQRSLPVTDGAVTFENVSDSIEITYDKMGIPQVWAKSEADALFGLGYLHASDRMFQMELTRRMARGRLSEIIGDLALDIDIEQRRIGHSRLAARAAPVLSEQNRRHLQSYCDGVNAYTANCGSLPFEFKLLPTGFGNWTIEDCLAVISYQAWFSHDLMSRDRFFIKLYEKHGPAIARSLLDKYPGWAPTTVPANTKVSEYNKSGLIEKALAEALKPSPFPPASNSWLISGDKSLSGSPMLACDPHLETGRLPQFWYYAGMHASGDSLDVVGITAPGIPLVAMGHNFHAAWSFTAGGIDITEYYMEIINPDNDNQYLTSGGWADFVIITDTILIHNSDQPEIIKIRQTSNGPVMIESGNDSLVYSMRWAGFDTDFDQVMTSAIKLNHLKSYSEFQQTVTALGALNANWMYADDAGNIGYQLGTPIPIRPPGMENLPQEGWLENKQWLGYYELRQMPKSYNPARGWLGSCNNKPAENLGYELPGNFFTGRILRLEQLLDSLDIFSIEDMQQFQLDRSDAFLLKWKSEVATALKRIGESEKAGSLARWDGTTGTGSRETLLMLTFLGQLKKNIFEPELGSLYSSVSNLWMHDIYFSSDSTWFSGDQASRLRIRTELSDSAMSRAIKIAGGRTWGEAHTLTMKHPLAVVPLLDDLLTLKHGPWPWAGTGSTLNASFYSQVNDSTFKSIVGPSFRFVIDFSDIDGAAMVLPAGNSGNPVSEHFFDFNRMWTVGDYWTVPISRNAVKEKATSSLVIIPGK